MNQLLESDPVGRRPRAILPPMRDNGCYQILHLTRRLTHVIGYVPGGARKWRLIEKAGPVEPAGCLFMQRVGISSTQAAVTLSGLCDTAAIPELLRTAHLIAGGIARGESRHRA
ncbi:MAG TPA: DUF99 family protein [Burkholderiales bacterium]|nr:DUF99 family protein [Burkholderiales bacterium]